mmetsp:Transcript_20339/g.24383  ORF Transcript_20339/g.24383 Transcript_20339/m.24383 type:complete len:218 (-) Transcript_20339:373-1026(-)|eukprot:CAMPEP_0197853022 /NCGR_PEP_ID=MMETSP1438-20131217/21942_1 /TAXON_ID=1461541 /ORGANISM="Pterosperma sp., Strain CCMP1384" /LENGTH=217 /DNA_ID=CAMNT_0043467285 /DNA_START=105 /DNA_END=758 /DNA_ORIENTATION=+
MKTFALAVVLASLALASADTVPAGGCKKFVSEEFVKDHEVAVTMTVDDSNCFKYHNYRTGTDCLTGSYRDSDGKCSGQTDPMALSAEEICEDETYFFMVLSTSDTETVQDCGDFKVITVMTNTCESDKEASVEFKDNGNVENSFCDAVEAVVRTANTILIIIIVVIVIAVVGGVLGCCFCCAGCPLYGKCCGANKAQPIAQGVPAGNKGAVQLGQVA